jgi:hypothetical protein
MAVFEGEVTSNFYDIGIYLREYKNNHIHRKYMHMYIIYMYIFLNKISNHNINT